MKSFFSIRAHFQDNPFFRKQKKEYSARDLLLADILKTQNALETAYQGFDNAVDPDLIDCYIYEVNSALKRYRFLLHQADSMQLFEEKNAYHIPILQVSMPETLL